MISCRDDPLLCVHNQISASVSKLPASTIRPWLNKFWFLSLFMWILQLWPMLFRFSCNRGGPEATPLSHFYRKRHSHSILIRALYPKDKSTVPLSPFLPSNQEKGVIKWVSWWEGTVQVYFQLVCNSPGKRNSDKRNTSKSSSAFRRLWFFVTNPYPAFSINLSRRFYTSVLLYLLFSFLCVIKS